MPVTVLATHGPILDTYIESSYAAKLRISSARMNFVACVTAMSTGTFKVV